MALSVLQLAPKIHSKAAVSKEIPTQLLEELAGFMLPASPPAWEQGKLLPANVLVLAAPPSCAVTTFLFLGQTSQHSVGWSLCRRLRTAGSWAIYPGVASLGVLWGWTQIWVCKPM